MKHPVLLFAACTAAFLPEMSAAAPPKARAREAVVEASIADLQKAMQSGRLTSRQITQQYLDRIQAIDKAGPKLNSVIEVNPDALADAEALDQERKARGPRGPMHGIPVLLKDNIATRTRCRPRRARSRSWARSRRAMPSWPRACARPVP
jgi:amidase